MFDDDTGAHCARGLSVQCHVQQSNASPHDSLSSALPSLHSSAVYDHPTDSTSASLSTLTGLKTMLRRRCGLSDSGSPGISERPSIISRALNSNSQVEVVAAVEAIVWGVFRLIGNPAGPAGDIYVSFAGEFLATWLGIFMISSGLLQFVAIWRGWYRLRLSLLVIKTFIWSLITMAWLSHMPQSYAGGHYMIMAAISIWATILVPRPRGTG